MSTAHLRDKEHVGGRVAVAVVAALVEAGAVGVVHRRGPVLLLRPPHLFARALPQWALFRTLARHRVHHGRPAGPDLFDLVEAGLVVYPAGGVS